MSDRLTALRTERDMIESRDDWANPALGYLNDTIEALEAEEKAKAPEPTTTEPAGDPLAALASEMEAALANPGRLSDAERDALVRCYNTAAIDAGTTSTGRVDVQAVARDMAAVASDPGALSHDERDRLFARYNQAARQGPERRSTEVLRADLAGSDLGARMRAAVALQERGELDDATASEVVGSYNLEVRAAIERGPDPAELPEEFRPAAAAMQAELERLQAAERDPTEAALAMFNQAVRSVKPPTLEQQLAELGVNAEPEQVPEPVSSTSQEA